jgi:hypothetical protein
MLHFIARLFKTRLTTGWLTFAKSAVVMPTPELRLAAEKIKFEALFHWYIGR